MQDLSHLEPCTERTGRWGSLWSCTAHIFFHGMTKKERCLDPAILLPVNCSLYIKWCSLRLPETFAQQWQQLIIRVQALSSHSWKIQKCIYTIKNKPLSQILNMKVRLLYAIEEVCWRRSLYFDDIYSNISTFEMKIISVFHLHTRCPSVQLLGFQFICSVLSDSLWPHGLRHARLPRPAPTPCLSSNCLTWGMTKNIICINILNLAKHFKYVLYFPFDRLAYIMTWKARFEFRIFSNSLESKEQCNETRFLVLPWASLPCPGLVSHCSWQSRVWPHLRRLSSAEADPKGSDS